MDIITSVTALRERVRAWKAEGLVVGLVPTMGALHAGHLSLVDLAKAHSDRVVVSVFVNPTQFNNPEDLEHYPRTEETDQAALRAKDVDIYFAPTVAEVYPDGFATSVTVAGLTDDLCGAGRPGHFDGVALVVSKLFGMVAPDKAFFGEKDWQQLQIVQRMTRDLNIGVDVVPGATVREADGLAMSSRNLRLTDAERAIAPALHREMQMAAEALQGGAAAKDVLQEATARIEAAGFESVEYLELRHAETLAQLAHKGDAPARLFAAAHLGAVRLIDNILV